MSSIRKVIGDNVRRLRLARGWSQEKLAERAGLHRTYVGGVERGERNIAADNIANIAKALDVKPYKLMIKTHSDEA